MNAENLTNPALSDFLDDFEDIAHSAVCADIGIDHQERFRGATGGCAAFNGNAYMSSVPRPEIHSCDRAKILMTLIESEAY